MQHKLSLPRREVKPRSRGLTMMIDGGMPTGLFKDVVSSAGSYIDLVKFGWGTAIVTLELTKKIDALAIEGIAFMFGGTLFEKYLIDRDFETYRALCRNYGCRFVEVSNGTIELDNKSKAAYISKLSTEFEVLAEVGFKDQPRSELFSPNQWMRSIQSDLDAGAQRVILEARETGTSGICRPDGALRYGLIEDILESEIDVDRLMFEAPTRELQAYFVKRIGTAVNLGNIAASDLIALETLRLGLRADTLLHFQQVTSPHANDA